MKPRCPKCGTAVRRAGLAFGRFSGGRGVIRYKCENRWKNSKGCGWHGTHPAGLEDDLNSGIDQKRVDGLVKRLSADRRQVRRYVITAAQNATPVHRHFFETLMGYCRHTGAQLLVIPYRYKNPTSMWTEKAKTDDWWAAELVPYLLNVRHPLNQNLIVLGDIKTQPTAADPLQGFEGMAGGQSAIVGHPKLELTTIATPHQKLPKILTTTGAVTEKNYIPSKAGKKGEFHHTLGACVVEVDGLLFHMRQLNALSDGTFMDLEWAYDGARRKKVERAAALVMGDSHVKFIDPQVVAATWGKGGMVPRLKPEFLVWHDVMDCYAGNHHERDKAIIQFVKHHSGAANVEREVKECFEFIDARTFPGTTNIIVPSNHPTDHLDRWVNDTDPRRDPENAVFWARCYEAQCVNARMTESGARTIDLFAYWGERMLKNRQTRFLAYDESFMVHGVELGYHGHLGPNGARGTRKAFGKIGVKTIIGHSHSPGIKDGVYQAGTSSRLRLSYNKGPSSWLQTHALLYANGKRTLINVVDGRWCA